MIRLKVNTKRHPAGALVPASTLGEAFLARLIAAGQAVEEPDADPADPVELVLHQVAEFDDQTATSAQLLTRIAEQTAAFGDADRLRVGKALLAVMERPSTWSDGITQLIELALDAEGKDSDDGTPTAKAEGADGAGGADAAGSQAVTPAEGSGGQDGAVPVPEGGTAPNDKPPETPGPSGDAGGASAPPAEPAKAPAPKPPRKSARAAGPKGD